jgi:hypothetical protein
VAPGDRICSSPTDVSRHSTIPAEAPKKAARAELGATQAPCDVVLNGYQLDQFRQASASAYALGLASSFATAAASHPDCRAILIQIVAL